jgi:hypothetical protein
MITDDPPKDGGPLLFVSSFLAAPLSAVAWLMVEIRSWKVLLLAYPPWSPGALLLTMAWVYFSPNSMQVRIRSIIVFMLASVILIVQLKLETRHIEHDDVLPLFFVIVAPLLLVGSGVVGLAAGSLAVLAFEKQQAARVLWLARVRAEGHPRYRIVPLTKEHDGKPPFLRFREGEAALLRCPEGDYREASEGEVIARVPLS